MFIWSTRFFFISIYFSSKQLFGNQILKNPTFGTVTIADTQFFILISSLISNFNYIVGNQYLVFTTYLAIVTSSYDTHSPTKYVNNFQPFYWYNTFHMSTPNIPPVDPSLLSFSCGNHRQPQIFIPQDDDS